MNHVAAIVGGFDSQQKHGGQTGVLFTPIAEGAAGSRRSQFLSANAFRTPAFLVKPEVLRRIEPAGALDRVRAAQQRVLASLLSSAGAHAPGRARGDRRRRRLRADRLPRRRPPRRVDRAAGTAPVQIDAFRRNLQRAYLETLAERVNGRQAASDDARALFRQELRLLDDALQGARARRRRPRRPMASPGPTSPTPAP